MSIGAIDIKYFKLAVGGENIGKETPDDIAVRCPVCGDSRTNKRMKRLHLYNKNTVTQVSCFNGDCPVVNKTVYSFLRDFYPALLTQYKRETFSGNLAELSQNTDVFSQFKIPEQTPISRDIIPEVQVHDLSQYLQNITDVPNAIEYLDKRGCPYDGRANGWYFGNQDLNIDGIIYRITDAIVIPLYYRGVMYGFYSRNIYNKTFYTYMNPVNTGYKVWDWFNINKENSVYIFEGVFDAIASGLNNVIALLGAKMPEERLKELKKPVFVLDNDKTGMYNAIQYAQKGCAVYVQPQNIKGKDINEVLLNYPELNIPELIRDNIFSGIRGIVRIREKL